MIRLLLMTIALAGCGSRAQPNAMLHGEWSAPVAPFRVVGNIYYVGARNIASYLIATPEGHILIDTGTREMESVIRDNIARLGFSLADVKILLNSHAHYDHVQGHAAVVRASNALVLVMHEDAAAVRTGVDLSPLADEGWEPVRVDRELVDGDTVTLGDTTLTAIRAPGHTPGCTVWTTTAREPDRTYAVVFYGCMRPNNDVKLAGNTRFPHLVEETRETFRRMRALAPDIYLLNHPEDEFAGKQIALAEEVRPHPLADPAAWPKLLDEIEAEFEAQLKRQR
ncbi:MAG: subclass B3 metallo-beta-lactamase [Kofleriaceae bacterium]|nr:subclass B3 metallo-beta-lactamase [Kofleriaceae bacterium]